VTFLAWLLLPLVFIEEGAEISVFAAAAEGVSIHLFDPIIYNQAACKKAEFCRESPNIAGCHKIIVFSE